MSDGFVYSCITRFLKTYFAIDSKNNYGRSVPTDWHRLYQSYTGVYNVDYFPEILFSTELEPITNPYREAEMLDDKNLLPILFGNMGGYEFLPQSYSAIEEFITIAH